MFPVNLVKVVELQLDFDLCIIVCTCNLHTISYSSRRCFHVCMSIIFNCAAIELVSIDFNNI